METNRDRLPLPVDLQEFADAILVVQQRIQDLPAAQRQRPSLSHELRRAVQAGRHDLADGRGRLAALSRRLDAQAPPAR